MGRKLPKTQAIEVGIFLLKFNLLLLPFYAIIYYNISFFPLQELYAKFIAFVLTSLGLQATASGVLVYLGKESFPIDISFDCLGWKSSYSLFALVFATRGNVKDKLKFLKIWVPVFILINFVRIISTVLIGFAFGFHLVEPIHSYVWQFVVVGLVIGVWYSWLKK